MNLPQDFITSMTSLFANPRDAADFFASFSMPRHYGIRVNELKISTSDFVANFADIEPIPWCKQGFYYTGSARPSTNPLYHAGLYYIQEPSAMSAASILNPQPGDKVLDLCASPGGKSTQIASALGGSGLLISNDINYGRIPQLVRNIELAGVQNAIILCERPARLADRFPMYFDKILVDAPCSGEGMFRKDPEAISAWDKNKAARLAIIQREILRDATKMLAPGGFLAYSTCTFNPIENEHIIANFLDNHPDFDSVSINHDKYGVSSANERLTTQNHDAVRIWPHRHRGEGHFIALLQRKGNLGSHIINNHNIPYFTNKFFKDFQSQYLPCLTIPNILEHRDNLLALPGNCPNVNGLNIVRLGLHLGTLKKGRFAPSFALAMALTAADFSQIISLPPDDPRIAAYLGGQTFEISAPDGYSLFCVDGYPLGFAKILNNRLKGRIIK